MGKMAIGLTVAVALQAVHVQGAAEPSSITTASGSPSSQSAENPEDLFQNKDFELEGEADSIAQYLKECFNTEKKEYGACYSGTSLDTYLIQVVDENYRQLEY